MDEKTDARAPASVGQRMGLIVGLAVVAAGAALAWSLVNPAPFRASADVLVTPLAADDQTYLGVPALRQTGDTARLVQTAVGLLDTTAAARLAAGQLGEGWSESRVRDNVDVQARGASNLVAVTADGETARDATDLANAYAAAALEVRKRELAGPLRQALTRMRDQLRRERGRTQDYAEALQARVDTLRTAAIVGDPTLSVAQSATRPSGRAGTPVWVKVFIAMLAGAALGVGVALTLEAVRPRDRAAALV